MKRFLAIAILFLVNERLAESSMQAPNEDAKLAAYFKENLDEEMKHRPLEASRLGDHRFDHLLDDVSTAARAAGKERMRKTLENLPKHIDYKKLSRAGQIDFEIWEQSLKRDLWLAENTHPFEDDPRVYNEYTTESVY